LSSDGGSSIESPPTMELIGSLGRKSNVRVEPEGSSRWTFIVSPGCGGLKGGGVVIAEDIQEAWVTCLEVGSSFHVGGEGSDRNISLILGISRM
jgi:hypothetical protein